MDGMNFKGLEDTKSFKEWLDEYEAPLYEQWVKHHTYDTYNSKTTVVVLTLNSGFEIVGTSGCEDPSKFSEQLGHKYALKDALRKLGEFTAFYRAENRYKAKMLAELMPTAPTGKITAVDEHPPMPDYIKKEISEFVREELRKYIIITNG